MKPKERNLLQNNNEKKNLSFFLDTFLPHIQDKRWANQNHCDTIIYRLSCYMLTRNIYNWLLMYFYLKQRNNNSTIFFQKSLGSSEPNKPIDSVSASSM